MNDEILDSFENEDQQTSFNQIYIRAFLRFLKNNLIITALGILLVGIIKSKGETIFTLIGLSFFMAISLTVIFWLVVLIELVIHTNNKKYDALQITFLNIYIIMSYLFTVTCFLILIQNIKYF